MARLSLIPLLLLVVPACSNDSSARNQDSADITPDPETPPAWFSFHPTQCGTNPWETDPQDIPDDIGVSGELAEIVAFLQSEGVAIDDIALLVPAEPKAVCEGCSCPRGDRLVVRASGHQNAKKLEKLDFVPFTGAVGIAPKQCGNNPWEQGDSDQGGAALNEILKVKMWAASFDAKLAELGFAHPVELTATCASCDCPRGDFLIILPKDAKSTLALKGEGLCAVELPVCEPVFDPCAGKSCGDSCKLCPPGDPDCFETAVLKQCNASGECKSDFAVCE